MTEHADLPFEKVTNRAYLKGLEDFKQQKTPVSTSRSRTWLDEVPTNGAGKIQSECLYGRVALDIDDPDVGREFYVGVRYLNSSYFSHAVVSWAATVAKVFFEPDSSDHELLEHVRVRRTLTSHGKEIIGVEDDWEVVPADEGSPFLARRLEVQQPPTASGAATQRRARAKVRPPRSAESGTATPPRRPVADTSTPTTTPPGQAITTPSGRPAADTKAKGSLVRGMRAVSSVEQALTAPRGKELSSVLATLQPDQYRLVARPGDRPLVVQGHPGTGKTIIAVHRAAYLVSSERQAAGDTPVSRLLFLGPSNTWGIHVAKAVRSIAERDVHIVAVPQFLTDAIDLPTTLQGGLDYSVNEVDAQLFELARAVKRVLGTTDGWAQGKDGRRTNIATVYSAIRYGSTASKVQISIPRDLKEFTRSLPSFGTAIGQRTLQPLLAAIAVTLYGPPQKYDHIIVDEAQDVSPLTWEVIKAHSAGGITIVGDMHQRRNDVGHSSWEGVIDQLDLTEDDHPVQPEVITRGYRSTQAILDFAKALLPASQRDVQSLQAAGERPVVRRAGSMKNRDSLVVEEAVRLCRSHPRGQVAVIILLDQLEAFETHLLKQGWRKAKHHVWSKGDDRMKVVTPTTARGVEFDGVVVVEPGDFPRNLGRVGQLYTSLTRANRELAVVHHKALPDELRRHERRK